MGHQKSYEWITQGKRRQDVLIALKQPMTAKQLGKVSGYALDCVSVVLDELRSNGIVECLNDASQRSRVFGLTGSGKCIRKRLCEESGRPSDTWFVSEMDWDLYGWVCFSHRSAVLKALREPMQPATIKRVASRNDRDLRMSANNVRDVIKLFLEKRIVQKLPQRRRVHPLYQLTSLGHLLRNLLMEAEIPVVKGGGHHG